MNASIVVERFRALGDPVRWAIVRELEDGTRCARALAELTDVSAPLLSHHLRVLREAGFVCSARRGRWIDYSLDEDVFAALRAELEVHQGVDR